tara:strand:+ start:5137 stop:5433 length:297 start_codon:yes stop_codon:yes gene_type:complete
MAKKKNKTEQLKKNLIALNVLKAIKDDEEITSTANATGTVDDAIRTHLSEYLNAFIVIGYDMNGEPVMFRAGDTIQDVNSLTPLIHKYIMEHVHNQSQ